MLEARELGRSGGGTTDKPRILIVDDEPFVLSSFRRYLSGRGYEIFEASDGAEAIERLKSERFDVVVTDLKMPQADGMEVLRFSRASNPDSEVIIMTGYGTVDSAVDAIQTGARDYLQKPVRPEDLDDLLKRVLGGKVATPPESAEPAAPVEHVPSPHWVVGSTQAMQDVLRLVERVAPTDSTVLISGESGTGKELVAQEIHFRSDRRAGPLVPVNCGAIPENLLESELFGHVKGAFTGAYRPRTGRFVLADKGTIFLDEVGELPPPLQVKLLRVLQTKEVQPLGGSRSQTVDFRVIAATNADLEKLIAEGRFREDLYYRLCVIPLELPPLRERPDDIPLLLEQFLGEFNATRDCSVSGLSDQALDALLRYHWPGNIRELKNVIERMLILRGQGEIGLLEVPPRIRKAEVKDESRAWPDLPDHGLDFNKIITQLENDLILQALERTEWNKQRAAELLRLNRTTLVEKIKKKKLKPTET